MYAPDERNILHALVIAHKLAHYCLFIFPDVVSGQNTEVEACVSIMLLAHSEHTFVSFGKENQAKKCALERFP